MLQTLITNTFSSENSTVIREEEFLLPKTAKETAANSIKIGAGNSFTESENPVDRDKHHISTYLVSKKDNRFSLRYTEFNKAELFLQINKELAAWIDDGPDLAIVHITKIKGLLEEKESYLEIYDETRLLLALFELIFENNSWIQFSDKQLRFLMTKVIQIASHPLEVDDVKTIMKEISLAKISILDSNNESSNS